MTTNRCDCEAPKMMQTTHEDTCSIYNEPAPKPAPAIVAECWTCWPAGMVIRDTNITSHRAAGHDVRPVNGENL